MAYINEVGNKYGILTVIRRVENDKHRKACFECKCECGNTIIVEGSLLRKGNTKSCGCRRLSAETAELGKRYGALTVISLAGRTSAKKILWNCQCDCGNMTQVTTGHLHSGSVTSCGCGIGKKPQYINEVGNKYGRLTVLELSTEQFNDTSAHWICKCECGNIITVSGSALRSGNTRSCGCINSIGEYNIHILLESNNIKYKSQVTFPDLIYKMPLKYDFGLLDANNQIIRLIEFDGPQHIEGNCWYTKEAGLRDQIKNQYALDSKIPLIRIPYSKRDTITLEDIYSDQYLYS